MIRHQGKNPILELYKLEKEIRLKVQEYNRTKEEINKGLKEDNKIKTLILKEK